MTTTSKNTLKKESIAFDPLLTVGDMVKMLRVTKHQIYSWTHQDKIPFLKMGKHLRFPLSLIKKWLESKYNPMAKEICKGVFDSEDESKREPNELPSPN